MPRQSLGPVVAVMNMKGGVGKTTIAANLFHNYWERSLSVLLVDFDPQFNLSQLLMTAQRYEALRSEGRTLWKVLEPNPPDSIFKVAVSDLASVGEIERFMVALKPQSDHVLDLVAGDWELALLNVREDASTLRLARARFFDFIDQARAEYDVVVLDCNPASSFMTRIAVEAATDLLVPVTLTTYAILGLDLITNYIERFPGRERPPAMRVLINEFGAGSDRYRLESRLRSDRGYGELTLTSVLRNSDLLRVDDSHRGFAVEQRKSWVGRLRDELTEIADEYAVVVGLQP